MSAIGRHARLELVFARRKGVTTLVHAYAEPPLRVPVARRLEPRQGARQAGGAVQVVLASSAPGIFPGDVFEQSIRVERGAHVRLRSQSALQIHPGGKGREGAGLASVSSVFEVGDEAVLQCEWDAAIPFAGTRFAERVDLKLASHAWVFWSDALMCGRRAHGEAWLFAELAHELRLTVDGAIKYLERYRIAPPTRPVGQSWVTARASYLGSAIIAGPDVDTRLMASMHRRLTKREHLRAAADLVEPKLIVSRLLGFEGPPFHDARARLARLADAFISRNAATATG